MKRTDRWMRGFEASLTRLAGGAPYSRSVHGDLTEFLLLFEKGSRLLKQLLAHQGPQRSGADLVLRIENFVNSELRWTVRDAGPVLKRLRRLSREATARKKTMAGSGAGRGRRTRKAS